MTIIVISTTGDRTSDHRMQSQNSATDHPSTPLTSDYKLTSHGKLGFDWVQCGNGCTVVEFRLCIQSSLVRSPMMKMTLCTADNTP